MRRFRRTGRFWWFRQLPPTLVGRDSCRPWWLKHRSGRLGSREADPVAPVRYPARGPARSCRGTPAAVDRELARPAECRSQALCARGSLALGAAVGSSSWTSCCGMHRQRRSSAQLGEIGAGLSRGIGMDAIKPGPIRSAVASLTSFASRGAVLSPSRRFRLANSHCRRRPVGRRSRPAAVRGSRRAEDNGGAGRGASARPTSIGRCSMVASS